MMLQRVPAWKEPIVTTTGSNGEENRDTMCCSSLGGIQGLADVFDKGGFVALKLLFGAG